MADSTPDANSAWNLPAQLRARLDRGLHEMSQALDSAQCEKLVDFILLLQRWNKVHNLTAIRDVHQMVSRHLLDSLSVVPYLGSDVNSIIDVGSGAGLPGIPLSISQPELSCLMIDSAERKTWFVQQAIASLQLDNARVSHARVQDSKIDPADCVVARAFSSPVDIIQSCQHLCSVGGKMLFMMGHLENHLEGLPDAFKVEAVHKVDVPDTEATRHIAICRRLSL